jgi:hypothetical protein
MFVSVLIRSMKNSVSRLVFSYSGCSGLVSGFQNLYFFAWSEKQLVNNCTVLDFPRNYPFVFVEKLFRNAVGGSEKLEYLKIKYRVRQRFGNGRVCADCENIWKGVEIYLHSFLTRPYYLRRTKSL